MSMKLSYRDKVIIIVVAVLVVIGIGIFCIIKPQYENLQVEKDRLVTKEADRDDIQARMDTLDSLKKQLEDDVKEIQEEQEQFLDEREYGETYQISKYLMELIDPSGINITGVEMNVLESLDLEAYTYNKMAVAYPLKINGDIANKLPPEVDYAFNNNYPDPPTSIPMAATDVTITYTCGSDVELFDAVQLVADCDKNIYLLSVSADYAETEPGEVGLEGELHIMVYELYPLDPADIDE